MNLFETYSNQILYAVILVAFFTPFILVSKIYFWYKTRELNRADVIWNISYIIMIAAAYVYLNPTQRLYCGLYTLGILAVFVGVVFIAGLFRK